MRRSLRDSLVDRLLPVPEQADRAGLDRILRRGSPGMRIRALRHAGASQDPPPPATVLALLDDPVPGLRRAAAWVIGWQRWTDGLDRLWEAARRERMDQVRATMATAAVRCGATPARAWSLLEESAGRRVASFYGPRSTAEASGNGLDTTTRRWLRTLDPDAEQADQPGAVVPKDERRLIDDLRARLDRDPEDRDALHALAVQQHPADLERFVERRGAAGRRESHAICEALGEHGDPRATPTLVGVLRAMDVDPGHGFAGRRTSAIALGRIGDPSVGPVLERALTDEALDHEGRPGAGLGIQFPVRSVILAAIGEAGCLDRADLLVGYLANTHGSALGGFYLPAMDALWKLGRVEPLQPVLDGPELPAANAVGLLAAMGELDAVRARLTDPRPRVAEAARAGLELAGAS